MEKVGIFGGTFDPIHNGHLITAQSVFEKRKLDKLILIPCHISPHKQDKKSIAPEHRLEMLKLAFENQPGFEVSDYEIRKGDVSYTYNTILEMKKRYTDLELIIGYDNLVKFDKWRYPDEIVKLVKLIVLKRRLDKEENSKNKYFENATIIDTPVIDISSTNIRYRLQKGLSIDYFVPAKISQYIKDHNLYIE